MPANFLAPIKINRDKLSKGLKGEFPPCGLLEYGPRGTSPFSREGCAAASWSELVAVPQA
jgi:hypothetical protein